MELKVFGTSSSWLAHRCSTCNFEFQAGDCCACVRTEYGGGKTLCSRCALRVIQNGMTKQKKILINWKKHEKKLKDFHRKSDIKDRYVLQELGK